MATRAAQAERAAVDPALPFKRRARRRLMGSVFVAVAVAIALPLVLDPEPSFQRPEIRVDIPPRDTPLPIAVAPVQPPSQPVAAAPTLPAQPAAPQPGKGATHGSGSLPSQATAAVPAPPSAPTSSRPSPSASTAPARPQSAQPPPDGPSASAISPGENAAGTSPPRAGGAATPGAASPLPSRWLVQVGLFSKPENATTLVSRIKAMGLPAYTEAVDGGQGVRLRVRVGPFATRGEADQARARLSLNGIEAALVSP